MGRFAARLEMGSLWSVLITSSNHRDCHWSGGWREIVADSPSRRVSDVPAKHVHHGVLSRGSKWMKPMVKDKWVL